jgi:lipoprotein NlpD
MPVSAEDPASWKWPVEGRLLSSFKAGDPSRNGIEIAGEEGRPIVATASGEVVYSGNGLIGYGELIIIKHSERMLSAYAHNRERLVVEGQKVNAGEKIAHMGRDERNRPMLHFEIRRNGTPQDPLRYLPRK